MYISQNLYQTQGKTEVKNHYGEKYSETGQVISV
jgi:hypothetical protein